MANHSLATPSASDSHRFVGLASPSGFVKIKFCTESVKRDAVVPMPKRVANHSLNGSRASIIRWLRRKDGRAMRCVGFIHKLLKFSMASSGFTVLNAPLLRCLVIHCNTNQCSLLLRREADRVLEARGKPNTRFRTTRACKAAASGDTTVAMSRSILLPSIEQVIKT